MRVLYLSYNGLLDPLGQSQVLQYLVGLAARGHRLFLVTFEKTDEWENLSHRAATRRAVDAAGIHWIPLTYHRRPPGLSTLWNIFAGLWVSLYLVMRYGIQIVHARGYITAIIALALKSVLRVKLIFDPRSFWPDERVEVGLWREGSLAHRIAKALERKCLLAADAVVALTESAMTTMQGYPYMAGKPQRFRVITTCANLDLFGPSLARLGSRDVSRPFTLGYLGTVGNPYLLDEVFAATAAARQIVPDALLLIINRRDHAFIESRARTCGMPMTAMEVKAVNHPDVPAELWRMSAGVIFITPTPSRRSCAPTKLGEFLAAGIPCIVNAGVGDVEEILTEASVGVVLQDFSPEALTAGVRELLELCRQPDIAERCMAVARRHFSLAEGVSAYHALYAELATTLPDALTKSASAP